MSEKTLYMKCKKIAGPIVQHYLTDLTKHDREVFSQANSGDTFLWAPRECGTFLIRLRGKEHRSTRAMDWFEAYNESEPSLQWHMVEATSKGRGHVWPVETRKAREELAYVLRSQAAREAV